MVGESVIVALDIAMTGHVWNYMELWIIRDERIDEEDWFV